MKIKVNIWIVKIFDERSLNLTPLNTMARTSMLLCLCFHSTVPYKLFHMKSALFFHHFLICLIHFYIYILLNYFIMFLFLWCIYKFRILNSVVFVLYMKPYIGDTNPQFHCLGNYLIVKVGILFLSFTNGLTSFPLLRIACLQYSS